MPCQNPSAVQTEQGSFMRPRGCSHLQTQPRRHSPLLLRKCTNTKYSLATRLRNRATGRSKSHGTCPFSSFKNVTIYPCLWHEANYQSDVFRSSTDPHNSPVKYPFFFAIITLIRAFGVGNAWVPSWTFAGQRRICRSQFWPSITWVPRTEFRFGGKRLYLLSYLSRPCQKYFHVSHRLRQEYLGFEVSLSSRVRSHLKRK